MNTTKSALVPLVGAAGILLSPVTLLPALALDPAPVEFFKYQYGPQLPAITDGGTAGYLDSWLAAPTGDGGWLTCWRESGLDYSGRLMVRLLPPAFDSPPTPIPERWVDIAGPPVEVAAGAGVSGVPIAGQGGALLVQSGATGALAQWYSSTEGGPAGAPVSLEPGTWQGTGDGTMFWLLRGQGAATTEGLGVALERSGSDLAVKLRFSMNWTLFPYVRLCAGGDRCLISSFYYGEGLSSNVRTLTIDAAGKVSPVQEYALPPGAFWLGAIPNGNGFYGVWQVPYPTGLVIEGRAMTAEGAWAPGSGVVSMGPAGEGNSIAILTPGPGAGILNVRTNPGSAPMLVKPGQPLVPLDPGTPDEVYGTDGTRVLTLQRTSGNVLLARRTMLETGSKPPVSAPITGGSGIQREPSLAWSTAAPAGPKIVFQVEGYGTQLSEPVTGSSKPADSMAGARFFTGSFSSPAQAWNGNLQLIAWRSVVEGPDGPDDVYGSLSSVAADGKVTPVRGPFLIAGGPGSQRAVAVSARSYGDAFSVVWRHEEGGVDEGTYLSEIRSATISAAGAMTPPGGRALDISLGELSAPDVDQSVFVYRAHSTPGTAATLVRRAIVQYPGVEWRDLSPPSHDAVSPRVLFRGPFLAAVWRDKNSRQIFLHREYGNPPLMAVSPSGQYGREPRLAFVSVNHFAVVWLEERSAVPSRVWMALADNQSVSSPTLVLEGWFDRDTLAVAGDGNGRVAIAVHDSSTGSSGLKVVTVAPFSTQQGGLAIAPAGSGLEVSWNYDPVTFPPVASTLETSRDLREWQPLSGTPPVINGNGRVSYKLLRQETEPHRYYRLRAALTNPPQ